MDQTYEAPLIIYEGELEVRAGTPFFDDEPRLPELESDSEDQ